MKPREGVIVKDFNINMPEGAIYVLNKLKENGYQAYIVGGCVRDSLIGIIPKDWDITTSATPQEIKQIFKDTYDTGIKHGTVTVLINDEPYEVTTFRIEGKYKDYRRPSEVSFTKNLIEDLKRRDFTINAIAYHPQKGLIDPFGGVQDIQKMVIKCVGSPVKRFKEDALRMLRAVRFSCQLNFKIDKDTFKAIDENNHLINKVSKERIREELNKMLLSDYPMELLLMQKTDLLRHILPELAVCLNTRQNHPYHIYNVGLHILKTVEKIDKDLILRWTMLLHDIGKPLSKTTDEKGIDHFHGHAEKSMILAKTILKRFRFDSKTIDKITRLIKWHDRPIEATPKSVRRAIKAIGEDIFMDLLKVKKADKEAQNPDFLDERQKKYSTIHKIYGEIKRTKQCVSIKHLAVGGNDLITIGIPEGKKIGIILNKLLDIVIEHPEMNNRDTLLNVAKTWKKVEYTNQLN
ncbi:MAG: hypothetical protein PWQ67_1486 [Clostridia bacterium]|nr:hypothetical protein [Clostridia bacterium]